MAGWRGPQYEGELPTLGWGAIEWMETNLIVPDGPTAGEPFKLTDEQCQFVLNLYTVDPHFIGPAIHGRSLVNARTKRRAVLSRPKGWGKSPLVAGLCLLEGLGDVILDGWDAYGEPVGRPWTSLGFKALIQIIAVSEDQTANTWLPLLDMVRNGPLGDQRGIEALESFVAIPNGRIQAATSAGSSREGFRPVFYAMDQTESWTETNGGIKLAAALRRNVGKVGGLSIETPNGFVPGENSVAEKSFEAYQKQREGKLRGGDGIYYDHREMPADTDTEDRESLRAGLAVAYGDSADVNGGWTNLDRIIEEYWDPDTDPQDAARYYGNQITAAADAWLTQPQLRATFDEEKLVADGETIVLGFDGSRSRARGVTDATALVGVRVSDGHAFLLAAWEQPDGPAGEGWQVPVMEVDAAVHRAFATYNVVGMYADPAKWETWVNSWEAKYGEDLKVKASRDHPMEWWMTGGRLGAIVRAIEIAENAVVQGEMTHDGSYVLVRHLLNARRRTSRLGIVLAKEHPTSPRKIDAAIAFVLAWRCRMDALAAGLAAEEKKKSKRLHRF